MPNPIPQAPGRMCEMCERKMDDVNKVLVLNIEGTKHKFCSLLCVGEWCFEQRVEESLHKPGQRKEHDGDADTRQEAGEDRGGVSDEGESDGLDVPLQ